MDRNRLLLVCAGLAGVGLLAGGALLGVQPQISQASQTEAQTRSIDQQNTQLASQLSTLRAAASRMDEVGAKLDSLRASVPDDAAIPSFLEELNEAASSTGVSITTITTSDAAAYTSPAPTTTTTSAETTGTSTPSTTPSPSPTATAPAEPAATGPVAPVPATNPLITAADFSTIPVTVTVSGDYPHALAYLSALQHGERLFLVNAVTQAQSSGADDAQTWTFGGYIYALTNAATTASTASTTTSQAAGGD